MIETLFEKNAGTYLLSHSIGLQPKSTGDAISEQYLSPWQQCDNNTWPLWLNAIDSFRGAVASLLQADTSDVCPQTNLSSTLTKIIPALPESSASKKTLLISEEDFPSLAFVVDKMQEFGYLVKHIPSQADLLHMDTWDAYFTSDVLAVLATHVQSNNGRRTPISEITALAKTKGIYTIVDIAQSAGVIPIDVNEWQADFIIGSCVKWLCGGPGAGFLWVEPTLISQLQPIDVGWFSHENPFEFDMHHFEYASDARRFWGGTPSVIPYVVATNSIKILLEIGVKKIYKHNEECKQMLLDNLPENQVVSPRDSGQRGGTLIVKCTSHLLDILNAEGVKFDTRDLGVRLSPHIYNSMAELEPVKERLKFLK